VSPKSRSKAEEYVGVKSNSKFIAAALSVGEKIVTAKDISNLKQKLKHEDIDDLQVIGTLLKEKHSKFTQI